MSASVSVAIPVRDGGAWLEGTLHALARQTVEHELVICDSGSRDGSLEVARAHRARVLQIAPEEFGHGRTRNLLIAEASGERVALLTQDAQPADERWLERLLGGFELERDVAIVYGPYRPRPGASEAVRLELERWFGSIAPDGKARVERLDAAERALAGDAPGRLALGLMGARGFFTDANACISRQAWERIPFRELSYAEDRALASDMLQAGFAKAYVPDAAVLHSHDYSASQQLRRAFDEWRGLLEVYGWREPADPLRALRQLRGELGHARRALVREHVPGARRGATLSAVAGHNVLRLAGAQLGSRADRLPARARRALSLERRGSFCRLDLERQRNPLDDR